MGKMSDIDIEMQDRAAMIAKLALLGSMQGVITAQELLDRASEMLVETCGVCNHGFPPGKVKRTRRGYMMCPSCREEARLYALNDRI